MNKFSPKVLLMKGRRSYHDMILEEAGLISYYGFGAGQGNKLWDQKGTNHGTINGATWTQKSNGLWTLDFDGENDNVNCGSDATIAFTDMPAWTIEGWVWLNDKDAEHTWFGKLVVLAGVLIWWDVDDDIWKSAVYGDNALRYANCPEVTPEINKWFYITQIWNGNELSLRVNGIKGSITSNFTTPSDDSDINLTIGHRLALNFWDGFINEIAIYNIALSADTIRKHYLVGIWEGLAEA